jgi:hypothetical protein
MKVKKARTEIMKRLSEQSLEFVSVFQEASRNFLLLFFSQDSFKIQQLIANVQKV